MELHTTSFTHSELEGAKVFLLFNHSHINQSTFSAREQQQAKALFDRKQYNYFYTLGEEIRFFVIVKPDSDHNRLLENTRQAASTLFPALKSFDEQNVTFYSEDVSVSLAAAEGLALTNYRFDKYFKKKSTFFVDKIAVPGAEEAVLHKLSWSVKGTCVARDLINEPLLSLTAVDLSRTIEKLGKSIGFSVEILNKANITSLRMGGLLAVNKGSIDPPTFSILEYKPANPRNKKPIVLVGKGVMYDTGGLSLKPTAGSMDSMKSDMSGAAAVVGSFVSLAGSKSDTWVIGLIPATDNRPGGNAITPGDVITMFDGTTVEVLNTDAEGRLILGDALAFAKKYDPELVIDLATLTGAAVIAIGRQGIASVGTVDDAEWNALSDAGYRVHERIARLPLWPEYKDMLKSTIADMKNIGGREAGTITAGKFLEHFTDYPWIHLDIAASAFLEKADTYRPVGGTGVGVRLLTDYIQNKH